MNFPIILTIISCKIKHFDSIKQINKNIYLKTNKDISFWFFYAILLLILKVYKPFLCHISTLYKIQHYLITQNTFF